MSLTKEQLKTALINHGVQPPSSAARKEEYEKLYNQHVKGSGGNFSSDDDDDVESEASTLPLADALSFDSSINDYVNIDGPDMTVEMIKELDDTKLYKALVKRGVSMGPIVATTRDLYVNLLIDLLKKETEDAINGSGDHLNGSSIDKDHTENGNGYSTDEDYIPKPPARKSVTPKRVTTATADTSVTPKNDPKPKSTLATSSLSETPKQGGVVSNSSSMKRIGPKSKTEGHFLASKLPKVALPASSSKATTATTTTTQSRVFASSTSDAGLLQTAMANKLNRKQVISKEPIEVGNEKHGLNGYFLFAAGLIILAIMLYFMIGRPVELTDDQKIDKEIDEVLKSL